MRWTVERLLGMQQGLRKDLKGGEWRGGTGRDGERRGVGGKGLHLSCLLPTYVLIFSLSSTPSLPVPQSSLDGEESGRQPLAGDDLGQLELVEDGDR